MQPVNDEDPQNAFADDDSKKNKGRGWCDFCKEQKLVETIQRHYETIEHKKSLSLSVKNVSIKDFTETGLYCGRYFHEQNDEQFSVLRGFFCDSSTIYLNREGEISDHLVH